MIQRLFKSRRVTKPADRRVCIKLYYSFILSKSSSHGTWSGIQFATPLYVNKYFESQVQFNTIMQLLYIYYQQYGRFNTNKMNLCHDITKDPNIFLYINNARNFTIFQGRSQQLLEAIIQNIPLQLTKLQSMISLLIFLTADVEDLFKDN